MNLTLVTEYSPCHVCTRGGRYRVTLKRGTVIVLCRECAPELVATLALVV